MEFVKPTKESSQVHSWRHLPESNHIDVHFHCSSCKGTGVERVTGACRKCGGKGTPGFYRYEGGSAELFAKLQAHESAGKAIGELIKKHNPPLKFTFVPNGTEAA